MKTSCKRCIITASKETWREIRDQPHPSTNLSTLLLQNFNGTCTHNLFVILFNTYILFISSYCFGVRVLVRMFDQHLTRADVSCMRPREWVNNFVSAHTFTLFNIFFLYNVKAWVNVSHLLANEFNLQIFMLASKFLMAEQKTLNNNVSRYIFCASLVVSISIFTFFLPSFWLV